MANNDDLNIILERMIVALTSSGIGVFDLLLPENRLNWDHRMYELYGIRRGDFSSAYEAWKHSVHPDDLNQARSEFYSALSDESQFHSQFRIVWPSGETRHIESRTSVFRDADGAPVRIVGTNIDITAKKVADAMVQKLSRIASQTANVVIMTDLEGITEWVNEAFANLTGYVAEEIVGKKPGDLLQGKDSSADVVSTMSQALASKNSFHVEIINYRKDGSAYWVELRCEPLFDDQQQQIGFMSIGLDIDRRIRHEQQLVQQNELLLTMNQQSRVGTWEVDLQKDKCYWSEMTKEIHKVPVNFEPSLQTGVNFYKEGASRELIQICFDRAVNDGIPWDEEFELTTTTGEEVWVRGLGQAMIKDGHCERLVGSFQDINDVKLAEFALIEAKDRAEAATHAKGEFLASMSHEIRTPINRVTGMLNLLQRNTLDKHQSHLTNMALGSFDSLLGVINDILDFSRIESGQLAIENSDFDIEDLVTNAINPLALTAQDKGINLLLDTTEIADVTLNGDPGRIRQILTNLVSNAVKFTHKGYVYIHLKLVDVNQDQSLLVGEIVDTGIGIPNNKLGDIFESFTQVDTSTTGIYGGAGLGLAITRNLCRLLGGDLKVESHLGKGSRFAFSIQTKSIQPQHSKQTLKRSTVLSTIADKETDQLLVKFAASLGVNIEFSSDVLRDIEQKENLSAILLDYQQQRAVGHQVLRELSRSNQTLHPIYIIDAKDTTELQTDLKTALDTRIAENVTVLLNPIGRRSLARALQSFDDKAPTPNQTGHPGKRSENLDRKVLVVEDNLINQLVVEGYLESLEMEYVVAGNGLEALNLLRQQSDISVILMDCHMPEMDGYDATRAIRNGDAGARYKTVPIIALTANAMASDRGKCFDAGMTEFLTKPVSPEQLEEKIVYVSAQPPNSNQ
ncbi:MAG: PAS domain S-box-containing protein [Candidatus Azotimanducaceae bacterium]|jgi:PAS domain S-box-containing protein